MKVLAVWRTKIKCQSRWQTTAEASVWRKLTLTRFHLHKSQVSALIT